MSRVRSPLKTMRIVLWANIVLIAIGVGAVIMRPELLGQRNDTVQHTGKSLIQAKFNLTDHKGKAVTQDTFRGRWMLVFFGYTNCPDICPTTLATVGNVMDELRDDSKKVVPLFITVDPARDTQQALAEYVQAFHPDLIGLTGAQPQIKEAARSFRVYFGYVDKETSPDNYTVGHSGILYLFDAEGEFQTHFSHTTSAKEIAAVIRKSIGG